MSELDIQPRVNSESISQAFEQNLRADADSTLSERGGLPHDAARRKRDSASPPDKPSGQTRSKGHFGYSDDPMLAVDDGPEDSWLIPSPGPASVKTFDISPPREEPLSRKTVKPVATRASTQSAANAHRRSLSGKRGDTGGSGLGRRMPESPPKASKLPRVAQLSSAKTPTKSPKAVTKSASPKIATSTPSQGFKSTASGKLGALRSKEVNANGSTADDSKPQPPAWRSSTQSDKLKAAISGRGVAGTKREEKSTPPTPSRPASAASLNSARSTVSQRAVGGKKPAVPTSATRSTASSALKTGNGPAQTKANTVTPAASAASKRRVSATGSAPNSRRVSRAGTEGPTAPVELLNAISGPEEDLAELARAAAEEQEAQAPQAPSDKEQHTDAEGSAPSDATVEVAEAPKVTDDLPTSQGVDVSFEAPLSEPARPPQQPPPEASQSPLKLTRGESVDTPRPVLGSARSHETPPRSRSGTPRSVRASKTPTPRPEWIDIVPPPERLEEPASTETATESGGTVPVGTEAKQQRDAIAQEPGSAEKAKNDVPEGQTVDESSSAATAAVSDDKPAQDVRPGVGSKKAADLPHDGYSAPEQTKQSCCGCSVM